MADNFNLGRPIGGGEHGAGTGLSGGYGEATAANTQSGKYAEQERAGFNAGLGGEHASGGIPHGQTGSAHPIADKFTSGSHGAHGGSALSGAGGEKLDNSLDNFSGEAGHGSHGHGSHGGALGAGAAGLGAGALGAGAASGLSGQEGVSGAYSGHGTQDALTGESHATRTGAGVGPLGENTTAPSAGFGNDANAASNLATAKSGVDTRGVDVDSSKYGTGVGASGGSGGHFTESSHSGTGAGLAAGAGAGALGAGAAGAAAHGRGKDSTTTTGTGSTGNTGLGNNNNNNNNNNTNANTDPNAKTGHFGTAETDFNRGAPVSDPKALDSGGPHGLVFQESTGKYVHRHELEGAGSATKH